MILGKIPYFGKDSIQIIDNIRHSHAVRTVHYNDMPSFISNEGIVNNNIIVIQAGKKVITTYVKDIVFNYRDREAYIPYYDYKIKELKLPKKRTLSKGHLLLDKTHTVWLMRYDFIYKRIPLNINTKIRIFNLSTQEMYSCIIDKWYDDIFDIRRLYSLYILSSYKQEDTLLDGHEGGYAYINRQLKGFTNYENKVRTELGLSAYAHYDIFRDFTDVRHYRYEELFSDKLNPDQEPYKIRRLRFDCMLYSIIQAGAKPDDQDTARRWIKLSKQECFMVYKPFYKTDPPLIFKSYWFGVGNYDQKREITRKA